MPSLIRFLTVIAVLAGLVYGAAFALTIFVEPEQREITQRVDSRRLNPQ
ncbi:MAG: histidine kinase [Pseudomonadota bacterium]